MDKMDGLYQSGAQAVVFMVREITHICRSMQKRSPGSEGERMAARYMADVLKAASAMRT